MKKDILMFIIILIILNLAILFLFGVKPYNRFIIDQDISLKHRTGDAYYSVDTYVLYKKIFESTGSIEWSLHNDFVKPCEMDSVVSFGRLQAKLFIIKAKDNLERKTWLIK